MGRRTDIDSILVIGSGPIVIGQACEFDYSGAQACKVLRDEGYRVVLVNSNPATIMTDPEFADATYVEPITPEFVSRIIEREKPDACLPTLGGQTGLNVAMDLALSGAMETHGVELIGATPETIKRAEDRRLFKKTLEEAGLELPHSSFAYSVEEALEAAGDIGYPLVVRPSYVLGGGGSGLVRAPDELRTVAGEGVRLSPIGEVLIEESIEGWKEYELELMRDRADNVVVVCSIENFDPMGVHTGDSITVAPAMTLTDVEYQGMRDDGARIMRAIGVETGGSNVQFAVDPSTGRRVVIEMNPRVSRSSALASKATGFPIAKIAAKLAVGYTLDEIVNDITRKTPACFEPSIDYVVVKIPRWTFEKFPGSDTTLGTKMKSVGEVMAIGRTFVEAFQKGFRSLERGLDGIGGAFRALAPSDVEKRLQEPSEDRPHLLFRALEQGMDPEEAARLTGIDPWFVHQVVRLVRGRAELEALDSLHDLDERRLRAAKRMGFSDAQIATCVGSSEAEVRTRRIAAGVVPTYKTVDTCAAEFEADTPYHYSTYEEEDEVRAGTKEKILILGSGPNRIGQGIEFDYCCVHAAFALKEAGFETIMLNCNPETVSTDYDTSDRLYFEPLSFEDVMNVVERERPSGTIVQLGGQTPLKLARALEAAGVRILGTSPDAIDRAEDRERFGDLLADLGLPQPPNGVARSVPEARAVAASVGYPVLVRPSYVLGGRAMEVVHTAEYLREYLTTAVEFDGHPVLIDKYLMGKELEVDAVCDGERVLIPGIMEHIERAGVHSGDSFAVYPPQRLYPTERDLIVEYTTRIGLELGVRGLMNVQYVLHGGRLYVIEVNPRSSRTVPFIAKATGLPLIKLATNVMLGRSLAEQGYDGGLWPEPPLVAVKAPVFSHAKLRGVEVGLGPEMKSTGEVMGVDRAFAPAFYKALLSAGMGLSPRGALLLSLADADKPDAVPLIETLVRLGYRLYATEGTAAFIEAAGMPVQLVTKRIGQGRPDVLDVIRDGTVDAVINTPGRTHQELQHGFQIRRAAVERGIPCITSMDTARTVVDAMARASPVYTVQPLPDYRRRDLGY